MHLVVNLSRMFLPSEIAAVVLQEIRNKGQPFHQDSVTVDRRVKEPFNIRAILSNPISCADDDAIPSTQAAGVRDSSNSATARAPRCSRLGNQTYTIFNLRRDITERGLYKMLSPEPNQTLDSQILWEEKLDGESVNTHFDEDKVRVALGSLNEEEHTKTQSAIFENTVLDFLRLCVLNNYTGMLRALGFSTIREVASDATSILSNSSGPNRYWSTTLAFSHLPIICRTHPTPMSNRSMDLLPLLILADATSKGLVKENRSSIKVSEELRGRVAITRTIFQHHNQTLVLKFGGVENEVPDNSVHSFLSNCRLIRFTGRYSFLRGFSLCKQQQQTENTEVQAPVEATTANKGDSSFGIGDFDNDHEVKQFLDYTSGIPTQSRKSAKTTGKASIRKLFSQQHFGEIPGSMKTSYEDFKSAFEQGIRPFGKAVLEFLRTGPLVHSPTQLSEVHDNQRKFIDMLQKSCAGNNNGNGCDPKQTTRPSDWKFLCQQEYIDITSSLDIPCLEPTSVNMTNDPNQQNQSIVEVKFIADINPIDANLDAFNHESLVLGHGSKQTLELMQTLLPKTAGRLTPLILFTECLIAMRHMTPDQLAMLGLGIIRNPVTAYQAQPIIYDLVTGRVFSILFFEHYMCKIFVLLRHLFPHSTMVQDPNPDSHFCHPEHPANPVIRKQLPIIYTLFSKCVNSFGAAALSSVDNNNKNSAFFRCTREANGPISFTLPKLICYPNEKRTKKIPTDNVVHEVSANYRAIQKNQDGTYQILPSTNN